MIGGLALLTLNDAVAKWLSTRYPVGEIIALRSLFIVITLGSGLGLSGGVKALKPARYWNQFLRGLCFLASSFAIVTALSLMPIADVTAITFASPLLIVALAGPLLGERVGLKRWVVAIIGFVGVLIIAKPTPSAFQWGALAALAAAVGSTARDMVTRYISAVESSNLTTFYSMVMGTAAGFLTAFVSPWHWPTGLDFWLFVLLGALNGGAHFMMIESYRLAEASIVAPFRYTALVWAILFGYVMWGDMPDVWLIAGSALVIGSGWYLFRHETRQP
ncbi:MAG: hypothetical protein ETSY2_35280 [Candidatus Entotheonella gemina]|uniref:EamA domain-containing protein n=2 Tax=Candidatus Entotheonella TaxID=93171 RepID=W4LYW6_9BACT|nr:MAG: hypothetical protein ETSY2_35280 [Candidatus Entotheonella gemina]